jgi:hypothetical protein
MLGHERSQFVPGNVSADIPFTHFVEGRRREPGREDRCCAFALVLSGRNTARSQHFVWQTETPQMRGEPQNR